MSRITGWEIELWQQSGKELSQGLTATLEALV